MADVHLYFSLSLYSPLSLSSAGFSVAFFIKKKFVIAVEPVKRKSMIPILFVFNGHTSGRFQVLQFVGTRFE